MAENHLLIRGLPRHIWCMLSVELIPWSATVNPIQCVIYIGASSYTHPFVIVLIRVIVAFNACRAV